MERTRVEQTMQTLQTIDDEEAKCLIEAINNRDIFIEDYKQVELYVYGLYYLQKTKYLHLIGLRYSIRALLIDSYKNFEDLASKSLEIYDLPKNILKYMDLKTLGLDKVMIL